MDYKEEDILAPFSRHHKSDLAPLRRAQLEALNPYDPTNPTFTNIEERRDHMAYEEGFIERENLPCNCEDTGRMVKIIVIDKSFEAPYCPVCGGKRL